MSVTDRVVVLTLSTETCVGAENCIKSLHRLGYEYYVLGRGKPFRGWKWRTQMYIKAIEGISGSPTDLFVAIDSNDLYLVGGPDELWTKFMTATGGKKVLVGAEGACCNGSFSERILRGPVYDKLASNGNGSKPYHYSFPNGGCVMGLRPQLVDFLRSNQDAEDDQGGYLQKLLDDPDAFHLDREQSVVGNIPNMSDFYRTPGDSNDAERSYWLVEGGRPVNRLTYGQPCILHFPGKNWADYNHFGAAYLSTTLGGVKGVKGGVVEDAPGKFEGSLPAVSTYWTGLEAVEIVVIVLVVLWFLILFMLGLGLYSDRRRSSQAIKS